MNDWQKGYQLEYLLDIEKAFEEYNSYFFSPFQQFKKHLIAISLSKGMLHHIMAGKDRVGYIEHKRQTINSNIKMYQELVIGNKYKGDTVINRFCVQKGYEIEAIKRLNRFIEPTWLFLPEEDTRAKNMALVANFRQVGTKFTSFAEIIGVYFRDSQISFAPRRFPTIDPLEDLSICRVESNFTKEAKEIENKLYSLDLVFQNHYSNYNKKKAWSAVSLRGFYEDETRIEKPSEMSDKWKEEHKQESPKVQDTKLRAMFPAVESILAKLSHPTVERIRLMKLQPNGGELDRHSDLVDLETGIMPNQLMRLHIPIKTNDKVIFSSWGVDGTKKDVNMKVGELWYLDTRKPHKAINGGTEERIHLVLDVNINNKIKSLIKPL